MYAGPKRQLEYNNTSLTPYMSEKPRNITLVLGRSVIPLLGLFLLMPESCQYQKLQLVPCWMTDA